MLLEKPDGSSVFILDPVVREGANVLIGTYARIQHVLTSETGSCFILLLSMAETWLHASDIAVPRKDSRSTFIEEGKNESRTEFANIEWDRAKLVKVF